MNEQEIREKIKIYEDQYADNIAQFAKWKKSNTRQVGSDAYNSYTKRVEEWQNTVLSHIQSLQERLAPMAAAGPVGPEVMMDQMLDDTKPMEFLMAVMTLSLKDRSFLPAVLNSYKNLKGNSAPLLSTRSSVPVMQTPVVVQPASTPFYAVLPSANYTVPPPTHYSVPSRTIAPGASTAPVSYSYAPPTVTVPPSNQPTTFPAPAQKIATVPNDRYRAPSPVRDYNTVTTPFLDFSMK